jgi:hypothetical protein
VGALVDGERDAGVDVRVERGQAEVQAVSEFEQPLLLTTPHITGQRVKDAQYLLAGHDRFPGLATYKDGAIDGDYGPLTAQAVKRAKFWLGYPLSACTPVFGQTVYEYLRPSKWRPLPDAYRKLRETRLEAAAQTPGQVALDYAAQFIGYHEDPLGSNRTQFGAWYGFNGVAWCAIFESYCFGHTGRPSYRYAAVEQIYHDALYGRNGLQIVRAPQPGDIACYAHNGDPYAHTGFYDHHLNDREFVDLSGNTSSADFANGGYVERHTRQLATVTAFVRVT